jgi:hypothetical protein
MRLKQFLEKDNRVKIMFEKMALSNLDELRRTQTNSDELF